MSRENEIQKPRPTTDSSFAKSAEKDLKVTNQIKVTPPPLKKTE